MRDKIKRSDFDRAVAAIEMIAKQEGTTPEQVRFLLREVITEGMSTTDPEVRARWSKCPCRGACPTPEEFLLWVADGAAGDLGV